MVAVAALPGGGDRRSRRFSELASEPMRDNVTLTGELLDELFARVEACEARQRAEGVHDPGCTARWDGRAATVGPCCCWLAEGSPGG